MSLESPLAAANVGRDRRTAAKKRDAQLGIIAGLRAGLTARDACEKQHRVIGTYYNWRRNDSTFRRRCDQAIEAWVAQSTIAEGRRKARDMSLRETDRVDDDFVKWRKRYLNFDTFPHLMLILDAMKRAGPGSIVMILLPPEWMKTTLLEDWITYSICVDPNERILAISEGQDHARKMLGRIARRLETDGTAPDLVADFGPFQDPTGRKTWNADRLTVLGADHDERDYTLETAGIKSTIRGARPRKIILDDVQSQRSLSETKKFISIFRDDIITRPGQDGTIIILGSRVGNNDVYEGLLDEDGLIDELVVLPALDLEKPPGAQSNFPPQYYADETPVVDSRGLHIGWSDEALARRRMKVGEDIWAQVYMQQPKSAAGALVSEEDILRATDMNRPVGARHGLEGIAGLDQALARHAAYMMCEFDNEHLYVIEPVDLFQPRRNEVLIGKLEELTVRYRPTTWVIENNTLQSALLLDDRFLAVREQQGFRSISHHTGSNKTEPLFGVPAMMSAIVRKEIIFPGGGDAASNPGLVLLFDQLIKWRSDIKTQFLPQDMVMALWFCYKAWRGLRAQQGADTSAWNRSGISDNFTPYPWIKQQMIVKDPINQDHEPSHTRTYDDVWAALANGGLHR